MGTFETFRDIDLSGDFLLDSMDFSWCIVCTAVVFVGVAGCCEPLGETTNEGSIGRSLCLNVDVSQHSLREKRGYEGFTIYSNSSACAQ